MDNLTYLVGASLHEDWHHFQNSWQGMVDAFLADDTQPVRAVPDDIGALLDSEQTAAEPGARMAEMGCSYDPAKDYRDSLEAVRDHIRNATGRM